MDPLDYGIVGFCGTLEFISILTDWYLGPPLLALYNMQYMMDPVHI